MDKIVEIENLIFHYLKGDGSEEELAKLLDRIRVSDEDKELFIKIKQVYDLRVGGLYPSEEEVDDSWTRLVARLEEIQQAAGKRPANGKIRRLATSTLRYAAAGLVFVFLTLTARQVWFDKNKKPLYSTLEVSPGPRMDRLSLPDGSTVLLNSSTKIRFPDRFSGKTREIFLDGEGYFDIVHQEDKPFIVRTSRQEISVLGTTFNVMDYEADDFAITTLVSGSVKVRSIDTDEQTVNEYTLNPDQQVYLDKTTAELILTDVKTDIDRMWMNKTYHFRDESLLRIVKRLEKLYGVRFYITEEEIKNEQYTGTFRLDQSIDDVLKIINLNKHFAYKITGDTITVTPRKYK